MSSIKVIENDSLEKAEIRNSNKDQGDEEANKDNEDSVHEIRASNLKRISESSDYEVDAHFEPVVVLPEIHIGLNEEDEDVMVKLRAKLFRFDTSDPEQPEWKERGTGEVKLLRHRTKNTVRVVMRRDKTYKVCANHFVKPWMELRPNCDSDRAFVWTVPADFADEEVKAECLAIRFANAQIASQWKEKFEEAKKIVSREKSLSENESDTTESTSSTSSLTPSSDDSVDCMLKKLTVNK